MSETIKSPAWDSSFQEFIYGDGSESIDFDTEIGNEKYSEQTNQKV